MLLRQLTWTESRCFPGMRRLSINHSAGRGAPRWCINKQLNVIPAPRLHLLDRIEGGGQFVCEGP